MRVLAIHPCVSSEKLQLLPQIGTVRLSQSEFYLLIASFIWVPHKLSGNFKSTLHNTKSLHH